MVIECPSTKATPTSIASKAAPAMHNPEKASAMSTVVTS
jgi:hypothetical protein